jgi:hypothetical protein
MADDLDSVPKEVLDMMDWAAKKGLTMEQVRKASKAAGRTAHKR